MQFLVHHESEDIVLSDPQEDVETSYILLDKLENKGIDPVPFKSESDINRFLSYDCGKWSIESAIGFTEEFFSRMGVMPPHDHIQSETVKI